MPNPVTFEIDYSQPRVVVPRIAVVARGKMSSDRGDERTGWDSVYSSGVWQDPIVGSLWLEPTPLNASWHTSNAGGYAKLAKADYGFTTAADWENFELKAGAGYYIRGIGDTTSNYALTSSVWGLNRGLFISWFAYNVGNDDFEQLRFGFGVDTANTDDQLWFKVWASGKIEVYWITAKIGEGSLSGSSKAYERDGGSDSKSQRYIDLMVLPSRGREVLLYSPTEGGGFSVLLPDIAEGTASPTIIRSTDKLWWWVPNGQAQVQTAKMNFASSGYVCSKLYKFGRIPANPTAYTASIYQDATSIAYSSGVALSLRDETNSAVYSSGESVRIRLDLTVSSYSSPIVFGAMAEWESEVGYTDSTSQFTLDNYITAASLSVPDSHENIELSLSLTNVPGAETNGFDRPSSIADRPIRIRDSVTNIVYFEGATEPLEWTATANPEAITGSIRARSLWKQLEEFVFETELPLDGYLVEDAITKICTTAGIPLAYVYVSPSYYTISEVPATVEQANFACQYHERGSDALNRLIETYCSDWMVLEYPGVDHVVLTFLSPDELPTVPGITLYDNDADAVTAGIAAADAYQVVIRDYHEKSLNPEANEMTIVGFDLRTNKPIIAVDRDLNAQDPTLAAVDRPLNWAGFARPYEFRHSMMTTLEDVEGARDTLRKRLFPRRYIADFSTELLLQTDDIPVWRGYVLTLANYGDMRVMSFQVDFQTMVAADHGSGVVYYLWRPSRYVGQYMYDAWQEEPNNGVTTRTLGTTVNEIVDSWAMRLAAKDFGKLAGAGKVIDASPAEFSGVP